MQCSAVPCACLNGALEDSGMATNQQVFLVLGQVADLLGKRRYANLFDVVSFSAPSISQVSPPRHCTARLHARTHARTHGRTHMRMRMHRDAFACCMHDGC